MWTLKSYLEALARLGREYVVREADGFAWPADELLDWLEWQAPEQLGLSVGFSGLDHLGGGVLFALDEQGNVISRDPLYWVVPHRPGPPATLPLEQKEDCALPQDVRRQERAQDT